MLAMSGSTGELQRGEAWKALYSDSSSGPSDCEDAAQRMPAARRRAENRPASKRARVPGAAQAHQVSEIEVRSADDSRSRPTVGVPAQTTAVISDVASSAVGPVGLAAGRGRGGPIRRQE